MQRRRILILTIESNSIIFLFFFHIHESTFPVFFCNLKINKIDSFVKPKYYVQFSISIGNTLGFHFKSRIIIIFAKKQLFFIAKKTNSIHFNDNGENVNITSFYISSLLSPFLQSFAD